MNQLAETISTSKIKRALRKMRGGSQAHLVEAHNGRYYVAKFQSNPQGNRSLINEWLMHQLLRRLDVCTPDVCLLDLPEELRQGGEIFFSMGTERALPQGRLHFGSQCPVNPDTKAIFDFLPAKLLRSVVNLRDFAKVFTLDQWVHHADLRQVIFTREPSSQALAFRAHFIDGGQICGGAQWELHDWKTSGVYMRRNVYSQIDFATECEQAIENIESLSSADIEGFAEGIPPEWFAEEDRAQLLQLLEQLDRRRAKLRYLVEQNRPRLTSEPADGAMPVLAKFPPGSQTATRYDVYAIAER